MRKKRCVLWLVTLALLLPTQLRAEQPTRWQPTLASAKRAATYSNRLVLVYFWADWCGVCRKMEHAVLDQPGFIAGVEADYVPVKVNADHFPATARQFGVTNLPTTVVLSPQGQPLEKLVGRLDTAAYLARLKQVAVAHRPKPSPSTSYAQINSGVNGPPAVRPQPVAGRPWDRPGETGRYGAQAQPRPTDPRLADARATGRPYQDNGPLVGPSIGPANGAPVVEARPSGPPTGRPAGSDWTNGPGANAAGRPAGPNPTVQLPPGNPPLGLDGYCPVSLADDAKKWTLGDRRWGAIHEGRTYLFAGVEQQRRFLSEPDRYSPVFGGNDVVAALESGRTASGRREHGAFFGSRVYLFESEDTLSKFWANPNYYSNEMVQMRRGGPAGSGPNISERTAAPPNPRLSSGPRDRYGRYQGAPVAQPPIRYR